MSKVVKTESQRDRGLTTTYSFPDDAVKSERRDEIGVPQLTVSTHHYRERKAYLTRIDRQVHRGNIISTMITFNNDDCPLPDSVRSAYEPTARYSAKGLAEFHKFAVEQLEAMPGPLLEQVFQWAKDGAHDKVMNG